MAGTNGTNADHLLPRNLPPYEPGKAYTLKSMEGEIIYIPCSNSALRLLVTGKETEGAFAIVGTGGGQSAPIGFHFHREAHDIFLCLKGSVNVWAEDTCRTIGPGDLASVPPGTVHQYQVLGDHTEFIGLIIPGGWEEFFRFIGEPYAGPMWPLEDKRNPFEVLIPKLKLAAEKFDMVPQPQLNQSACQPQPWTGKENVLPGKLAPYYLQANKGPKYLVEGVVVKPMVTTKESGNKFAIGSFEGSSLHSNAVLGSKASFADVHHALHIVDGEVRITVDGASTTLKAFETIYIPKGSVFSITIVSRYARVYTFANGGGILELLVSLGENYDFSMLPEKESSSSKDKLLSAAMEHGCKIGE